VTVPDLLISADSHVDVSHDSIKANLASRFHDDYDAAVHEFETTFFRGKAARAVRLGSDFKPRPGAVDGTERLKDMDLDGVAAEVVYSEVSAFRFLYLLRSGFAEATAAFNETLADYASVDRARLIVSFQIPIHSVDIARAEVLRAVDRGVKSLQLPVFPSELGCPEYPDSYYDPLWSLIEETELPICCHIGYNAGVAEIARRDPTPGGSVYPPCTALATAEAFGMWIMGGVFARHPRLKVVFVEPGIGWVPWWVQTADRMYTRQSDWYEMPGLTEPPSYYFLRNVFLTYVDEPVGLGLYRQTMGVDNALWSTDYPHPVTSWPNSRKLLEEQLSGIPDAEARQLVSGNATRVWQLAG
jgi:predicted TIM-barrel fold metal-dependent hydrolase